MEISQNSEHFSNTANTHRKHVKYFIFKNKWLHEKWLEAHYQQHHPISMNGGLLPYGIVQPAGFSHAEPSWFNYSRCTWMAIDKLSIKDLLIDNVPGAPPPPDDTPNE